MRMSMKQVSNIHEKDPMSNLVNVSNIKEYLDYTESDASYPLFRVDRLYSGELIQCLTCKFQVKSNSFSDIYAHYTHFQNCESSGTIHFYKCLYWRDVHFYVRSA